MTREKRRKSAVGKTLSLHTVNLSSMEYLISYGLRQMQSLIMTLHTWYANMIRMVTVTYISLDKIHRACPGHSWLWCHTRANHRTCQRWYILHTTCSQTWMGSCTWPRWHCPAECIWLEKIDRWTLRTCVTSCPRVPYIPMWSSSPKLLIKLSITSTESC